MLQGLRLQRLSQFSNAIICCVTGIRLGKIRAQKVFWAGFWRFWTFDGYQGVSGYARKAKGSAKPQSVSEVMAEITQPDKILANSGEK